MRRHLLAAALAAIPFIAHAAPHGMTAADLVGFARLVGARAVARRQARRLHAAGDRPRAPTAAAPTCGCSSSTATRRRAARSRAMKRTTALPTGRPTAAASTSFPRAAGSAQVWFLPVAGGEAMQVTRLPLDVAGFRASPRGDRLVVAHRSLPRLRRPRMHEEAARGEAGGEGSTARPTTSCSCATGTSGRTAASRSCSRSRSMRERGARRAGAADRGARRRRPLETARRPRGLRIQSGRGAGRVLRARARARASRDSTNFDICRVPVDGSARAGQPDRPTTRPGTRSPRIRRTAACSRTSRWSAPASRPTASASSCATPASGAIRFTSARLGPLDRARSASPPTAARSTPIADDLGQRPLFAIDLGKRRAPRS